MPSGNRIALVSARQVYSDRGHPGVEATVVTENGGKGVALVTAGVSVGDHEIPFVYDGGVKWRGKGVQRAVDGVNTIVAPAIKGMDSTRQMEIDDALLNLGGPDAKHRLGGNATAAVSAAALKAGASSLAIPLYQHIGGVNACILPVPGVLSLVGSRRYGGGPQVTNKPTYSFYCYGFDSFSEASYAGWDVTTEFTKILKNRFGLEPTAEGRADVPPGIVQHDRELWGMMNEVINRLGYEHRVGLQVDIAANSYYSREEDKYVGLFSRDAYSRDDLRELYHEMSGKYAFVVLEDPFHEDDYESHALLTRELAVEVVGDDLFTTDPARVKHGIQMGACNAVLLKVNQIGTITEAFEVVRLAYRHGYGVMPCNSRGEGQDIADYTVGLSAGHLREGAIGIVGNRLLQIERELGSRALFLGRTALKP